MNCFLSVKVCVSHSRAISSDVRDGSQAILPNAYQDDWANSWPHQLLSRPMLATPAMAVVL